MGMYGFRIDKPPLGGMWKLQNYFLRSESTPFMQLALGTEYEKGLLTFIESL